MLNKKLLGIEIGTFNTKIIVCENKGKKIIIKGYRIIKTPTDAFSHDDTLNIPVLTPVITKAFEELKCKKAECFVVLSSRRAIVRERDLPKVSPKDMSPLVQYEAEQLLPYNIDEFITDYRVLGEENDDEKDLFRVMIVAVPKEIINSYTELIKECNLKLKGINVYQNCVYKYASKFLIQESKNTLLVDIGDRFTKMTIFEDREYFVNINSEIGGHDVTQEISLMLGCSMEQAEGIKLKNSELISSTAISIDKGENMVQNVKVSLESSYSEISNEITKIIDFFRTRKYGAKIDQIVLFGKGSCVKGLSEYLENILDINVTDINVSPEITYNTEEIDNCTYKALVPTIGAITRGI